MTNDTKTCIKCGLDLPLTDYHQDANSKDGHVGTCRTCWTEYDRQRGQTLHRKARLALKDSKRARKKAEEFRGESITDTLTFHEVLWVLSDSVCALCGQDVEIHERSLDHITPMRYGGSNTLENATCVHKSCNAAKSDLPAITYMLQSCDAYEARELIDRMASRGNRTFNEAFLQLAEHAKAYYETKAKEALERIKDDGQISAARSE